MSNGITQGGVKENGREVLGGCGVMRKEVARSGNHIFAKEGTQVGDRGKWELEEIAGKARKELVMGARKIDLIMRITEEQGQENLRELLSPEGGAIEAPIRIRRSRTIKDGQGL